MIFNIATRVILLAFVGLRGADGATYRNPNQGFSFEYDEKNWTLVDVDSKASSTAQDVDKAMAQRTLVSVQHNQADEKYRSRFSVVIDNLDNFKGSPAEQLLLYQTHALNFLKSQRFQILGTTRTTLPKLSEPAFEILANQRDFGLTFRQVIFIHGGLAYLLTVAARTARFDSSKPEMKPLFDSFSFNAATTQQQQNEPVQASPSVAVPSRPRKQKASP